MMRFAPSERLTLYHPHHRLEIVGTMDTVTAISVVFEVVPVEEIFDIVHVRFNGTIFHSNDTVADSILDRIVKWVGIGIGIRVRVQEEWFYRHLLPCAHERLGHRRIILILVTLLLLRIPIPIGRNILVRLGILFRFIDVRGGRERNSDWESEGTTPSVV